MGNRIGKTIIIPTTGRSLTSYRLEGVLLLVLYMIIAVAAWYVSNTSKIAYVLIYYRFYPDRALVTECPK